MRLWATSCALWLAALAILPRPARAETVMAVGGGLVEGRVVELDREGRLVVEPVRRFVQGARLPVTEVVEVRYDRPAEGSTAEVASTRTIRFANGDSLQGDVLYIEGESLVLSAPHLGKLTVPLEVTSGVWHPRQGVSAAVLARAREALEAPEAPAEDVLFLANGDAARGVIAKLAGGRIELEHLALKKRVLVDLHDVIALRFARTALRPPAAGNQPVACLELRDGSRLSGALAEASTERLCINWLGGRVLAVPLRDLVRVTFRGGRLEWLSDLAPAAREEQPLLGPTFKLSADRTPGGRELSIAGRSFRRGLSTRPVSRYTWKLDGGYEAFEGHIGIDDEAGASGGGCVRFRVLVDGVGKFDSGTVRGGEAARYVRVDLSAAKEITLCVEEAGDLDIAGFADWAEAHLIRPAKTEDKK